MMDVRADDTAAASGTAEGTGCPGRPIEMNKPTPLAIILVAMHRRWAEGDEAGAVALARVAAPYVHPRAPAAKTTMDVSLVQDAELDSLCHEGGAGAAPEDTGQPE